jgi:hypothetical protein
MVFGVQRGKRGGGLLEEYETIPIFLGIRNLSVFGEAILLLLSSGVWMATGYDVSQFFMLDPRLKINAIY